MSKTEFKMDYLMSILSTIYTFWYRRVSMFNLYTRGLKILLNTKSVDRRRIQLYIGCRYLQ